MPDNIKSLQIVLNVEIHEKGLKIDEIYNPIVVERKNGFEKITIFQLKSPVIQNKIRLYLTGTYILQ